MGEVLGPELEKTVRRIDALDRERSGLRAGATLATLRAARRYAADLGGIWAAAEPAVKREAALMMGVRIAVDAGNRTVRVSYNNGYEWLSGS